MKHLEMIPGSSYNDELKIENGTKNKYTLYLKVETKDQSVLAEELLDNITMKIYLDNEQIYNGNIRGMGYIEEKNNLHDAVKLKQLDSGDKSLLKVETELSSDYNNKNNSEIGKVEWLFYAQYANNQPQIIDNVAKTDLDSNKTVYSIIILILGFLVLGINYIGKISKLKKKINLL